MTGREISVARLSTTAFASARTEVVKIVSPSRGPLTVESYARSTDSHDTEHLRQIQDVRALPDGAGERLGVSGLFGPMALVQYATHVADHDVEHLAQMARARAAALGR